MDASAPRGRPNLGLDLTIPTNEIASLTGLRGDISQKRRALELKRSWAPNSPLAVTRNLWYALGTCHDFESKRLQSARSFYTSVFAAHHAQLAIMFLWASLPLFQIGWQGSFESWAANPGVTPISHAIRDPHFGANAATAFSASIVSTTGVYEWYYTIGLRTMSECLTAAAFLVILAMLFLASGIIHAASADTFQEGQARILAAGDSSINHHLGGFLGVSSIAWAGHLVHVAIPRSRGQSITWQNLTSQLPHPEGLKPFATLDWSRYAAQNDGWSHGFGVSDTAAGTAVLSFLGSRLPSSDSLWLTDVAHHHLALGIVCIILGNLVRSFSLNEEQYGLHWYLALSLASLGTASSFAATHIDAFTVYAYLSKDFTAMSAIYTHHQYIAGFFVLGGFAHGAIYLIRDANLSASAPKTLASRFVLGLLTYRSAIISHLSAITLFLGFHTLGLYVHNDVMQAFGAPELEISISPVFGQWLQVAHGQQLGSPLSCGDVLVHHAIALGLHTTVLVLLKAALMGRSSKLMPDKVAFGYGFP